MTSLASEVLNAMEGKTLATAESCTGGLIGAALTAVPGSSAVYKGGVISYWSEAKESLLGVDGEVLRKFGAVSAPVAEAMALGTLKVLESDVGVSVTGLAGPGGDEFGNSAGTVFIGYADGEKTVVRECHFFGDREAVRRQATEAALEMVIKNCK